jgi:hypothetical protein
VIRRNPIPLVSDISGGFGGKGFEELAQVRLAF